MSGGQKMKVNFKKTVCLGISAILAVAACSCGNKGGGGTAVDVENLPDAKYGDTYPIETDETLTLWSNLEVDAEYKKAEDMPLYKTLSEKTGINIDYIVPSTGSDLEQFNLMVASGNLPDIIVYDWYTCYGNPTKAMEDNIILPLNGVFEKYAPNVSNWLEKIGDNAKQIRDDEGRYFGFPSLVDFTEEDVDAFFLYEGPMIRSDLLEKYGLESPETLDELYNVLKTFKANGIKSPLVLEGKRMKSGAYTAFMFGAFGTQYTYYQDNGKIKYGPLEPGFKDALMTYNKWYKEGLLDNEFASMDDATLTRKMTDGSAGATIHYVSRLAAWTNASGFKYDGFAYPTLEKGKKAEFGQLTTSGGSGTLGAITSQCKNIELAAKFLDYGFSDEGILLNNYGIEGTTYNMVDGVPTFTDEYLNDFDKLIPYSRLEMTVHQLNRYNQRNRADYQQNAFKVWQTNQKAHGLPSLMPTAEESDEQAQIITEVNTYVEEMVFKFITGYESFDNYDAFVENVKKMGAERVIELKQAQLDRYADR